MFHIGDRVIYGGMGVCRVRELRTVCASRTQPGGQEQLYYVLQQLLLLLQEEDQHLLLSHAG